MRIACKSGTANIACIQTECLPLGALLTSSLPSKVIRRGQLVLITGSVISINELKLASPSDSHTTSAGDSCILVDSESTDADSTSGNYEPSPKRPVDRILMTEHHKPPGFDCRRSVASPDSHSEAKLSNRPSSGTSSVSSSTLSVRSLKCHNRLTGSVPSRQRVLIWVLDQTNNHE
ncbi:hypothetical protein SprV_0301245700 [Sparganum proliferum]